MTARRRGHIYMVIYLENYMRNKTIYLLSPKISWKTFKKLQLNVKDSGPTPKNADKMLWQLLREEKIYCWFGDLPNDMSLGLKLPKGKIEIVK